MRWGQNDRWYNIVSYGPGWTCKRGALTNMGCQESLEQSNIVNKSCNQSDIASDKSQELDNKSSKVKIVYR